MAHPSVISRRDIGGVSRFVSARRKTGQSEAEEARRRLRGIGRRLGDCMGYGFTLIISSESAISSPFRRHYERSYPVFTAFWRQVGASFQDCSLKRIGRSNYRMIRIPRDARTEHSEYPRVLLHLAHVATGCIGLLPVTKHCAGNRTCKKELICLSSFVPAVITDDARSATGRLPKSCGRTCRASLPSPSVDDNLESV